MRRKKKREQEYEMDNYEVEEDMDENIAEDMESDRDYAE